MTDPGKAVNVLLAILVPDGCAFGFADGDWLDRRDEGRGDVVAVAGKGLLMRSLPDDVHA